MTRMCSQINEQNNVIFNSDIRIIDQVVDSWYLKKKTDFVLPDSKCYRKGKVILERAWNIVSALIVSSSVLLQSAILPRDAPYNAYDSRARRDTRRV